MMTGRHLYGMFIHFHDDGTSSAIHGLRSIMNSNIIFTSCRSMNVHIVFTCIRTCIDVYFHFLWLVLVDWWMDDNGLCLFINTVQLFRLSEERAIGVYLLEMSSRLVSAVGSLDMLISIVHDLYDFLVP